MRYVYTVFIFLVALLISTGCGLVQRAADAVNDEIPDEAIPVEVPAENTNPVEVPRGDNSDDESAENLPPQPEAPEEEEDAIDPEVDRAYIVGRTLCLMSHVTNEDPELRIISRHDTVEWSNGDKWVYSYIGIRRNYRQAGSFTAEGWYLNGEAPDNLVVDFGTWGHTLESFSRKFKAYVDGDDYYVEEPGYWTARAEGACEPANY